jgi:hypothetical protein
MSTSPTQIVVLYYYFYVGDTTNFTINNTTFIIETVLTSTDYSIKKFTYSVPNPISMSILNKLYNLFLSNYQSTNLTSYYYSLNQQVLSNLRMSHCFALEPDPMTYCDPSLMGYYLKSPIACSRINSKYGDNINSYHDNLPNYVKCSEYKTILADKNNSSYTSTHSAFETFCYNNPNAWDCQCYNRNNDPTYMALKTLESSGTAITAFDKCWYKPCQNQPAIIVPPLISQENSDCPNICANIILNVNVKNLVQNDINLSTDCFGSAQSSNEISNIGPSTNIITPPPKTLSPPKSPNNESSSPENTLKNSSLIKNLVIILISLVIFFIATFITLALKNIFKG